MADKPAKKEFGKRRPVAEPPRPPVKRSGHVALLVMGTIAVGTTAYTLMPRQNCEPTPGAVPGQTTTTCTSSSSSSGGSSSRWSSRSSLFSGDSSSHSSSGTSSNVSHSSVSRGGFGSFGHGFSGGG
ncbi:MULTISPECIES: hypothetical protein [Bradyrhizobium]|uniref:Uncharacterized protein n=1 Tax=Bradyrhizobium yuanmingense TaxID=108015 RepID=A0A1C3WQS2_9BRAD|nr:MULTISPECIES: hypothetical protein [Bradyrhizobium]MCA1384536.1 hypothetical protein [Bradyrhizobium sp. BRP05]MCA1364402.1 hypothetical protein [Bradyrhizobium sp. IC4059]MCA1376328.1 hypothetical protein [Bradyrhizobium sp. IC4060]MCA1392938.1 hypothetical protein [Bradyrhizobium sp. IC3123]MCA1413407.1 hypothetical protein [Bradyrhizobium sp. NBAIM20]